MKKVVKIISGIIGIILICFLILLSYLWIKEYRPEKIEDVKVYGKGEKDPEIGKNYKIMTWNIGYGGLDKDTDFFMDGGNMVFPINKNHVENSINHIISTSKNIDADIKLFQEVDYDSKRTFHINQVEKLRENLLGSSTFALNFKASFVPYPIPPMGKVESGIMTQSDFKIKNSKRYQQEIPHKFPTRLVNLKRAFNPSYIDIKNSDKKLVIINVHLDAYESGNKGRVAQTKEIIDFVNKEYKKGNYVLVGGDFNQELTGKFKKLPEGIWNPSPFPKEMLTKNIKLYYDKKGKTSVVNDKPYTGKDAYLSTIDGFLATDNIKIKTIKTQAKENFQYSDHNPVVMEFVLK
ncbi:MAG: endonuclease [Anaerococcus hydrogenalis]|uniref:endonuclease/exonuclease/phosphatase family protein n=1 Tax=Anaerococcus hydrogenalis TaxID=33029 RepID=UPI002901B9FB|nr:endonuclease [Anaerococcus hydrogenalis]MDU2582626.1 endonuclease [Anaerococcus hydrogenalis]